MSNPAIYDQILKASAAHKKPEGKTFQYGTAGFRMKANLLDAVAFRVGLLASLRSRKMNGQVIAVMITASHNEPADNGVKVVDPMGDMLEQSWEAFATQLTNAETDKELVEIYKKLEVDQRIKPELAPKVIFAKDTRESGPALVASLRDALEATNTSYTDYGDLTTPQLHYIARCLNTKGTPYEYGEPTEAGYYDKLATAYKKLMLNKPKPTTVTVDAANGVGGPKLKALMKVIGDDNVRVINSDTEDPSRLNSQCGADYVKTNQRLPPASSVKPLERCASLDGDADRIVYYFNDSDGTFRLLDGDKIATLVASFLVDLIKSAGLSDSISLGVVQTAYANGASTDYIARSLNLPVVCAKTGVKYVHHEATKFDCGVYFEANGHGTVVFSSRALARIQDHRPTAPSQENAWMNLLALTDLINQAVGDALSDLLLVEVILAHKKWGPKEWNSTYTDLPNRLVKVTVSDKSQFQTTDAERRLTEPIGLQDRIDALVGKYKLGRSFVRASGTEDAMRVYAEASTRGEADELAFQVSRLVEPY